MFRLNYYVINNFQTNIRDKDDIVSEDNFNNNDFAHVFFVSNKYMYEDVFNLKVSALICYVAHRLLLAIDKQSHSILYTAKLILLEVVLHALSDRMIYR